MDLSRCQQKICSKLRYLDRLQTLKAVAENELAGNYASRVDLLSDFIEEFPFEIDLWRLLIESQFIVNSSASADDTLDLLKWGISLNPRNVAFIRFTVEKAESISLHQTKLYNLLSSSLSGIALSKDKQSIWIKFLALLVTYPELEPNVTRKDWWFFQYARLNILSLESIDQELNLYQNFLRNCSLSELKTISKVHLNDGEYDYPIDDLRERLMAKFQESMLAVANNPLKQQLIKIEAVTSNHINIDEQFWMHAVQEAKKNKGSDYDSGIKIIRFLYETALTESPHSAFLWQSYFDHLRTQERSDRAYLFEFFGKYRRMLNIAFPKFYVYLIEFGLIDCTENNHEFTDLATLIVHETINSRNESNSVQLSNSDLVFERIIFACAFASISQNSDLLTKIRQFLARNFFFTFDEIKISELLLYLFSDEILKSAIFCDELWSILNALKYKKLSALSIIKVFEILNRRFSLVECSGDDQISLVKESLGQMRFNCKLSTDVRPLVPTEHMSENCLAIFNKWCVDMLFEAQLN